MNGVSERTPLVLPVTWNRRFQTWKYEIGHRCPALRSPKPEYVTNIDVQFHNVRLNRISTPTTTYSSAPSALRRSAVADSSG